MAVQTINLSLPKELLARVDAAAASEYASRSDFLRQALVERLRAIESLTPQAPEVSPKLTSKVRQSVVSHGRPSATRAAEC